MKCFVMARLAVFCGLLLACVVHAPVWADEQEEASEPEPTSESATQSAESRADAPFEVFVPSEQISEDIPVPFPVDI